MTIYQFKMKYVVVTLCLRWYNLSKKLISCIIESFDLSWWSVVIVETISSLFIFKWGSLCWTNETGTTVWIFLKMYSKWFKHSIWSVSIWLEEEEEEDILVFQNERIKTRKWAQLTFIFLLRHLNFSPFLCSFPINIPRRIHLC